MAESAFTQMERTLSRHGGVFPALPTRAPSKETSKTERLRQLIKEQGPISPLSLAVQLDLEGGSGLVRALLKADFERGRVFARDGKYLWNPAYDDEIERQLRAAARLLRSHGYAVRRLRHG